MGGSRRSHLSKKPGGNRREAKWLGSAAARRFGLQLVANQPKARLHSQLDIGAHSRSVKVAGREPVRMNPGDAEAHGLRDGALVRIFNDRGLAWLGWLSAKPSGLG